MYPPNLLWTASVLHFTKLFSDKSFFPEDKIKTSQQKAMHKEEFKSPATTPWKTTQAPAVLKAKLKTPCESHEKQSTNCLCTNLIFYSWFCKSLTEGHQHWGCRRRWKTWKPSGSTSPHNQCSPWLQEINWHVWSTKYFPWQEDIAKHKLKNRGFFPCLKLVQVLISSSVEQQIQNQSQIQG